MAYAGSTTIGNFCSFFFAQDKVFAQSSVNHQPPTLIERGVANVLEFEALQASDDQVLEALLFIRPSDQNSFQQQEALFQSGRARFTLQVDDPAITSIEYYFVMRMTDDRQITWPDVNNNEQPVRVDVVGSVNESLPATDLVAATILSPAPGEVLGTTDNLIAVALFYEPEDIEDGIFRLMINGQDVTDDAEFTPFLIKYTPDFLSEGEKTLQVTMEREGTVYEVAQWSFRVVPGQSYMFEEFDNSQTAEWRPPSGTIELGVRNQEISGTDNDAYTGRFSLSGREGKLSYSMDGYTTSQETPRLQPQNRFNLDMSYDERYHLQAGDVYPVISGLTVTGRRIRGLDLNATFLDDLLETQFVRGRINRSISPVYQQIMVEEEITDGTVTDTLYTLGLQDGQFGTYSRSITAARFSYGQNENFSISLHGLKIQDDTTSINVISDFSDVLTGNPDLSFPLRPEDRTKLEQNPEILQVSDFTSPPRGNVVAGMEISMSLDEERIRLQSEGGFSLLSQDIRGGPLDQMRAEELGLTLSPDTEKLYDRLSWLIIINEHMESPPFRYIEDEQGATTVDPFISSSHFANDTRLNLNYYNHQMQVRYRWIGPGYQSLANSTIRRDVAGFNITDRFRLMENRLYITLGYENLHDNLANNRNATTRTSTYRGSTSWYPLNPDLPRLSLSGYYSSLDNGIQRFNPYVAGIHPDLENAALTNFTILDGDTLAAPAPRLRATNSLNASATQNFHLLGMDHQLIVSYGMTKTRDRLFSFGDNSSKNLSLRLSNRLSSLPVPLRTWIGFNLMNSESTNGLSSVKINGLNLGAETFLLDDSLRISTDVAMTANRFNSLPYVINDNGEPSNRNSHYYEPGDESDRSVRHTNAYILRMNMQYEFDRSHSLMADVNFTNISDPLGTLGSIPNDRILQLRYIYRI